MNRAIFVKNLVKVIKMKKKYDLILTDCPWLYDNAQQNDPKRGGVTYPTMTMKDMCELPIHKAAKDNAVLVYWVTMPKLFDQYYEKYDPITMIRMWGFRPVTALFVWVKTNKKAIIPDYEQDDSWLEDYEGFYSGLGRYTNSNVEIAIVARRKHGKMLPRLDKSVKQLIVAPIGKHSVKPREQYNRLDRLFGTNIDRVELFARNGNLPPAGWDYTGLESTGEDIRDWIKQYE